MDQLRYSLGSAGNGGGFNAYAAGNKQYGSGRSNPTMGPVDRTGYIDRQAALAARRNAILRRLQGVNGQYIEPSSVR
jgi:hypothetical protein